MKKPIQISIPTPCHENWAAMTPADKGRFCASCQKTVRDFTKASDREIAEAVKTKGELCGRFRASQLERDLFVPKEKGRFWAAAITLMTLGVNEVAAQAPVNTEQHDAKTNSNKKVLPNGVKMITGTVLDEQGLPIPGVNVKVKGQPTIIYTDIDGIYSVQANDGDVLEFTYVGMVKQTFKISERIKYDVVMKDDTELLEEIIVGGISPANYNMSPAKEFILNH